MTPLQVYDITYNDESSDSLDDVLRLQRTLMDMLNIDLDDPKKALLSAGIGMSCEAAEVLDLMNKANRPWKTEAVFSKAQAEIVKETIDVLFYAFEIFNLVNLTSADVASLFGKKFIFNCARILESNPVTSRFQALTLLKKSTNPEVEYFQFPSIMKAVYWLRDYHYFSYEDELTERDMQMIYNPTATVTRIQEGKLL